MADKRTEATRAKIKRAFTHVMAERGFGRLSVSDVARRADLNRGTVYLHFTDKYDMLSQFEDELLDNITGILFDMSCQDASPSIDAFVPNANVLASLRYMQREIALFQALMGPDGDPRFAERLKKTLGEHLLAEVSNLPGVKIDIGDIPVAYAREIALGSIMAIVTLWLNNGAGETPEFIAHVIDVAKRTAPLNLLTTPLG
ncbi:TetR/AcrR family transcriptional regulator [uncultured Enorma sp.]|uniref:TetR/AcrR family transcriptional regulator n=1 Tax=uncultured Enorma sp. TaxID=1714346 RepID=UPI0028047E6E|nr:TetR/AcrR family transcriptional regulator [uncultured Enorma sp.]